MVWNRPATSVELVWDASDNSPENTYGLIRRHPVLWGILCGVSESEFSSRMWTVENGALERLRGVGWSVQWTLEKQVAVESVEMRPKRDESGGLRLFALMTRYGTI